MFGNYAVGGAIDFRMRTGEQINGFEVGTDAGSFGYLNNYMIVGKKSGDWDVSLFASNVKGDGYIFHTGYDIETVNMLTTWSPTNSDRVTFKFIFSNVDTQMGVRLTQANFYANPFQTGCVTMTSAAGCQSVAGSPLPKNGVYGNPVYGAPETSDQLGLHRDNTRDIAGVRYEHDFDPNITWHSQFVYDYTDNRQPTQPTWMTDGPIQGINLDTGLTARVPVFGIPASHYIDFYYDNARTLTNSYFDVPLNYGDGAIGSDANVQHAYQSDIGVKEREELSLTKQWIVEAGVSTTLSDLKATSQNLTAVSKGLVVFAPQAIVTADRSEWNTAPEVALVYRPNPEWQGRVRYDTGFGTPLVSELFTTPTGATGDNTGLKTQVDQGIDVGVDWKPWGSKLVASATVFNEWYYNQQLAMAVPNSSSTYYTNAAEAIHRGVETTLSYSPFDGWRVLGAYALNDQHFVNYMETITGTSGTGGTMTKVENRAGKSIPDVPLNQFTGRLGYDVPYGDYKGFGGYVEYVYRSGYTMDNANETWAPSYGIVNVNLHYNFALQDSFAKSGSLFFSINNVFDKVYISSQAGAITDTVVNGQQSTAAQLYNSGSIAAGAPRSFMVGLKLKFD